MWLSCTETESSYSAWPQLQSFYIWRQFAFVFQFLVISGHFCTSVHFNSWITSLKLGLHGTNLTTAMKRKSSAGFSVWLLLTFAFTALTYLASLPFTDSVGQAKLETDHTPRFLNNKAENYPFHTRLHKVMVNWQMVTSQSGSLRVYTVPAVDVIWENFP